MADYTPNLRKNGQVVQPNVAQMPDNNGWPEPLTDESNPVRQQISVGKNGESIMNDGINTSQAKNGGWHLAEGQSKGAMPDTDGAVYGSEDAPTGTSVSQNAKNPLKTSANLRGQLSKPEGGSGSQNNV